MQPLYGFISDKLGLKKNILFMISLLLVFTGPFYIFVYGPLLQYNVFLGAIVGEFIWELLFSPESVRLKPLLKRSAANINLNMEEQGCGGPSAGLRRHFCRSAVQYRSEYQLLGCVRLSNHIGGHYCFRKIEMTDDEKERADSVGLKDVGGLFLLKDFWF